MNETEEFEFRARAEREAGQPQQKMGGKPPLGYVLSQASKLAPWNRVSAAMPEIAGNVAERMGKGVNIAGHQFSVPPKVAASTMLPLSMLPELLAFGTMVPEKGPSSKALESLADKARASASSRWFKTAGGTLANAKELGSEESLRLGRLAREGRYVTPFNSATAQSKLINKGLQQSGKRLGELRNLADLYGDSPEAMKIVQTIKQDLGPKYATGIRSGESGDLQKAVEEVLKLEPVDKLTATEEMAPKMTPGTIEHGVPSREADPFNAILHKEFPPKESYEQFRRFQEDPNFIPEYDLRRPTTFGEVAKVSTDLNKYAKGQSKMLQPSGALTDAANVISKLNNERLLKALPPPKGVEYQQMLDKFSDLSKLDRMNELKSAYEVGGSRNSIINNIANRIFHRFGYQLSAEAMDKLSDIISAANNAARPNPAAPFGVSKILQRFRNDQ